MPAKETITQDGPVGTGPPFKNPQLVTPLVDGILVGGLSLIVIVGLLITGLVAPSAYAGLKARPAILDELVWVFVITSLINSPHFMGSYWMLYSTRGQVKRYPWATIYVPVTLVAVALLSLTLTAIGTRLGQDESQFAAVMQTQFSDQASFIGALIASFRELPLFVGGRAIYMGMFIISITYLAWHYNGQAWGMTASFCYLAGIRMRDSDRRLIRSGFRAMTGMHVLFWAIPVAQQAELRGVISPGITETVSNLVIMLLVLAFTMTIPLGIWGFRRAARRSGRRIPLRAILPWLAIYSWYLLIFVHPYFFLVLQLSHALQYLSFPLRVGANRHAGKGKQALIFPCLLYLGMLATGYMVFDLPLVLQMMQFFNLEPYKVASLVAIIVNIHHYFTDGAIWKISNPDVRRELFSHLVPRET
ncbi:MAG: hypothetical protein QGH11_06355 [Pirellulaceae bacterium]|nr:hypothetical protein [Pirellulaceae bacterium]